jgi:enoyl-CoA hydratase/carnithine racemase
MKMRDELEELAYSIRNDSDVAVAVLRDNGEKAFCAGADLTEFLTATSPTAARKARWQRDVWGNLLSLRQPLIAGVHGYVLGVGLELALCCDIRIAAEDAKFGFPEAGLGIIPAGGGTQTLPRHILCGRALEMILTGRVVTAQEALHWGIVNSVVSKTELDRFTDNLATTIAQLSTDTVRTAKEAVRRGRDLPLREGLKVEAMLSERLMRSFHGETQIDIDSKRTGESITVDLRRESNCGRAL